MIACVITKFKTRDSYLAARNTNRKNLIKMKENKNNIIATVSGNMHLKKDSTFFNTISLAEKKVQFVLFLAFAPFFSNKIWLKLLRSCYLIKDFLRHNSLNKNFNLFPRKFLCKVP